MLVDYNLVFESRHVIHSSKLLVDVTLYTQMSQMILSGIVAISLIVLLRVCNALMQLNIFLAEDRPH